MWNAVAQSLGVKRHQTTAYHPQANGLCERFHRSMKALCASLKDSNWVDKHPWVLLGIRTAPKASAELDLWPATAGSRGFRPWRHRSLVGHSPAVHAPGQCKAFCICPHFPSRPPSVAHPCWAMGGRLHFHSPRRPQGTATPALRELVPGFGDGGKTFCCGHGRQNGATLH